MLNIGMMWRGDPEKTLKENVSIASLRFNRKYSDKLGKANTCHVHINIEATVIDGIKVIPDKSIMKNIFWIGNSNDKR